MKNNCPLKLNNAISSRSEGNKHMLIFNDLYLEDSGEYKCVASNPYGEAETKCIMHVARRINVLLFVYLFIGYSVL